MKFFEHFAEYERVYRALLGSKGSPWFVPTMRASLAELVTHHDGIPGDPHETAQSVIKVPDEFVPSLVSVMLVEAVTWWLEHGRPYTPEEMATRCAQLAMALFKEVATWR